MIVEVSESTRAGKKYMAKVGNKTIHSGAKGMEDYTTHGDPDRKRNYIARHQKREDWTNDGVHTAGFVFTRWSPSAAGER